MPIEKLLEINEYNENAKSKHQMINELSTYLTFYQTGIANSGSEKPTEQDDVYFQDDNVSIDHVDTNIQNIDSQTIESAVSAYQAEELHDNAYKIFISQNEDSELKEATTTTCNTESQTFESPPTSDFLQTENFEENLKYSKNQDDNAKVQYVCTVCECSFFTVDEMIKHMSVHSYETVQAIKDAETVSNEFENFGASMPHNYESFSIKPEPDQPTFDDMTLNEEVISKSLKFSASSSDKSNNSWSSFKQFDETDLSKSSKNTNSTMEFTNDIETTIQEQNYLIKEEAFDGTIELSYSCHICDLSFMDEDELCDHMKIHNINKLKLIKTKGVSDENEIEYESCRWCGFSSTSASIMIAHISECTKDNAHPTASAVEVMIEEKGKGEEFFQVVTELKSEPRSPEALSEAETLGEFIDVSPKKKQKKSASKNMNRYAQKREFRKQWLTYEEFQGWLESTSEPSVAYCKLCNYNMTAEISVLKRHMLTQSHQDAVYSQHSMSADKEMTMSCYEPAIITKQEAQLPIINSVNIQETELPEMDETSATCNVVSMQPAMAVQGLVPIDISNQVMVKASVEEDGRVVLQGTDVLLSQKFQRYARFWDREILATSEFYNEVDPQVESELVKIPKFRKSWLFQRKFQDWLRQTKNPRTAFCIFCRTLLNAGISDLKSHGASRMHHFYTHNEALRPLSYEEYTNQHFESGEFPTIQFPSKNPESDEDESDVEQQGNPRFKDVWLVNEELKPWLCRTKSASFAFCMVCRKELPAKISRLRRHMFCGRHWYNSNATNVVPITYTRYQRMRIRELVGDDGSFSEEDSESDERGQSSQYTRKFRAAWLDVPNFKDWLRPTIDKTRAKCIICMTEMKSDITCIKRHLITKIHQKNSNKYKEDPGSVTMTLASDNFGLIIENLDNNLSNNVQELETDEGTYVSLQSYESLATSDNFLQHVQRNIKIYNKNENILNCSDSTTSINGEELVNNQTTSSNELIELEHRCQSCSFIADTFQDLQKHRKECQMANKYQCPTCNLLLPNYKELKNHLKLHKISSPVKDVVIDPEVLLKKKSGMRYNCSMCSFKCRKKLDFKIHTMKHTHQCFHCSYKSITFKDLEKHIEKKHQRADGSESQAYKKDVSDLNLKLCKKKKSDSDIEEFLFGKKCIVCRKTLSSSVALERHVRNNHPDTLLHCCHCDFTTHCEEIWAKHTQAHENKGYITVKNEVDITLGMLSEGGADTECLYVEVDEEQVQEDATIHVDYVDDQRLKVTEFMEGMVMDSEPMIRLKESIKQETIDGELVEQITLEEAVPDPQQMVQKDSLQEKFMFGPQYEVIFCNECDLTFNSEMNYQTHLTKLHSVEFPHVCTTCSFRFDEKIKLKKHKAAHKLNVYECDRCPYKTKLKGSLEKHLRRHEGIKPFQCQFCVKKFTEKTTLKRHILIHTGEKNYQCKYCNYRASCSTSVKYHIKQHHTKDELFKCTLCNYETYLRANIERHLKRHSGEKDLKCQVCEFATNDYTVLKRHMYRHGVGEKKYQCELCQFKFYERSTLRRHMKTHVGNLPYHCNICTFRSNYKGTLTKHVASMHQMSPPITSADAVTTILTEMQ